MWNLLNKKVYKRKRAQYISMEEEINKWFNKPKDDLEKAKILFNNQKFDGAAFFCQQSIEKGLKTIILKKEKKIIKIHDLTELGKIANLPKIFIEYCKSITLAYIYSRYPDIDKPKNIREIVSNFIRYTQEILLWVEKNINI